jgi:hypothetical protein
MLPNSATIAVGRNAWETTDFAVGDDSGWSVIIESFGNLKTPSDLYLNPQQWGFVLDHESLPEGIELGFDQLETVPEPSGLALFSAAVLGAVLFVRGRRTSAGRPNGWPERRKPAHETRVSGPRGPLSAVWPRLLSSRGA